MEKTWFLNQCWILGEEMDDDVMDQQKYAVSVPSFSERSCLFRRSLSSSTNGTCDSLHNISHASSTYPLTQPSPQPWS